MPKKKNKKKIYYPITQKINLNPNFICTDHVLIKKENYKKKHITHILQKINLNKNLTRTGQVLKKNVLPGSCGYYRAWKLARRLILS